MKTITGKFRQTVNWIGKLLFDSELGYLILPILAAIGCVALTYLYVIAYMNP